MSKYRGKEQMALYLQANNLLKRKQDSTSQTHQLKELDISGCNSITDKSILRLTEVFEDLEVFRIGKNPLISNLTMKAIARNIRKLRLLDIR